MPGCVCLSHLHVVDITKSLPAYKSFALLPQHRSTEPELLLEFGVFLAKPVGEKLLQTDIFFLKFHQIPELVALWRLSGDLLPLVVGLFRYPGFLDSGLDALSTACLLLDLTEL